MPASRYDNIAMNDISRGVDWGLLNKPNFRAKVCTSGELSVSRDDFERFLHALGYQPVTSVTAATMFLVIPNGPVKESSKIKTALASGSRTTILTESQFCEIIVPRDSPLRELSDPDDRSKA